MARELKCPNCGAATVPKEDGSCVCAGCGGTFTFKDGEAHLTNVGEYDKLKGRVDHLETSQAEIAALLGQRPPRDPPYDPSDPPAPPAEPDANDDTEVDDDDPDEEDW